MFCGKGSLAPKVEVVIAASEDALHGLGGSVPGRGYPGLVAAATQVVVIAHQALKPPAPEIPLHTRVTGHPLMSGHDNLEYDIYYRSRQRLERAPDPINEMLT